LIGNLQAMPRIAICYRHDDSLDITGRIFDRLARHFGRKAVFRDIDNIPPGADFRRHVERMLDESDIVLEIVGPRWIGPGDEQGRLASAADPVRLEIETALRKNKPLIPVLVSRAVMPHPDALPGSLHDFAYRNAVQVDSGQDFDLDVGRLIRGMERILRTGEAREGDEAVRNKRYREISLPKSIVVSNDPKIQKFNRWLECMGYSQVKAAEEMGGTPTTIYKYIGHQNKIPKYILLACEALEMRKRDHLRHDFVIKVASYSIFLLIAVGIILGEIE
jgi:hypothetical protein